MINSRIRFGYLLNYDYASYPDKIKDIRKIWKRETGFSDMDAGMWLVSAFFKVEYWNFQDKLLLWFREASQNLNLFRQLFFSWLPMGGPKKKCWKIAKIIRCFFQHFSFGPPLETMKKKSCLNKLKFWEASRNHKRSLSWKFQYSILKNVTFRHPYLRILFPFLIENSSLKIFGSMDVKITPDFCS